MPGTRPQFNPIRAPARRSRARRADWPATFENRGSPARADGKERQMGLLKNAKPANNTPNVAWFLSILFLPCALASASLSPSALIARASASQIRRLASPESHYDASTFARLPAVSQARPITLEPARQFRATLKNPAALESLKLKTRGEQIQFQEAGPSNSWVRGSDSLGVELHSPPRMSLRYDACHKDRTEANQTDHRDNTPLANPHASPQSPSLRHSADDALTTRVIRCYYGYWYYNASMGRWSSRDLINELGHRTLSGDRVFLINLEEDINLNRFIRNNPANLYDGDGRLVGYMFAGLASAVYACAKPQHDKAMQDYADSGDKFKHCWVSCRISKSCGAMFAQLAGLGKEARDIVKRLMKDMDGGAGDWIDSLEDLIANQQCIGWESNAGPVGGWIGALWRRSCEDRCKEKVGYYTRANCKL